jgi:pyridoxal phosphate enzyme (YggS family)
METPNTLSPLHKIQNQIELTAKLYGRLPNEVKLLAVTKNQPIDRIIPLVKQGQSLFGENRTQEAETKWPGLKDAYNFFNLHLIGHLQTNKVKQAVALFDAIQTLDSVKLAHKLFIEEQRQQKKLEYYIQINIGREPQKSGVLPEDFADFYKTLLSEVTLNVTGLMCIPPQDKNPAPYFEEMANIAKRSGLAHLSMGMSDDYETAIQYGATMVRLGRALFS